MCIVYYAFRFKSVFTPQEHLVYLGALCIVYWVERGCPILTVLLLDNDALCIVYCVLRIRIAYCVLDGRQSAHFECCYVLRIVYYVLCIGCATLLTGTYCVLRIVYCWVPHFERCLRIAYCVLCTGCPTLSAVTYCVLCIAYWVPPTLSAVIVIVEQQEHRPRAEAAETPLLY